VEFGTWERTRLSMKVSSVVNDHGSLSERFVFVFQVLVRVTLEEMTLFVGGGVSVSEGTTILQTPMINKDRYFKRCIFTIGRDNTKNIGGAN